MNTLLVSILLALGGLGGMTVLVGRRITEARQVLEQPERVLDRMFPLGLLPALKARVAQLGGLAINLLEKTLRYLKIFALKLDNTATNWIRRLRARSHNLGERYHEWRIRKAGLHLSFDRRFIAEIGHSFEGFATRYFSHTGWRARRVRDDLEPQERELVSAILRNPRSTDGYRALGIFYFEKGNYQEALAAFEAMKNLDPENAEAEERINHLREVLTARVANGANGKSDA